MRTFVCVGVLAATAMLACDIEPHGGRCLHDCTIKLASNSSWSVYALDPADNPTAPKLGRAQTVCLNENFPPHCPAGAALYGAVGEGWMLDRTPVPGAEWVWAPGEAPSEIGDLRQFFFSKTFDIDWPERGTLSIAADDFAAVHVNGHLVGTIGSVTDVVAAGAANHALTTFDLTHFLVSGSNTITVGAQNGPATFGNCGGPCAYHFNPAGVVFGGSIVHH